MSGEHDVVVFLEPVPGRTGEERHNTSKGLPPQAEEQGR